jgi:hypothetical protein
MASIVDSGHSQGPRAGQARRRAHSFSRGERGAGVFHQQAARNPLLCVNTPGTLSMIARPTIPLSRKGNRLPRPGTVWLRMPGPAPSTLQPRAASSIFGCGRSDSLACHRVLPLFELQPEARNEVPYTSDWCGEPGNVSENRRGAAHNPSDRSPRAADQIS